MGAETVVGVDLSAEQLAHARKLRALYGVDVQFLQSDVTTASLADDSFDVAASVAAFQTVEQLDQTLSGTFTALAAGTARAKTWKKGRVSLRSMW
nr:class I SAM-dependent methyltransferase [Halovenus aranensis]